MNVLPSFQTLQLRLLELEPFIPCLHIWTLFDSWTTHGLDQLIVDQRYDPIKNSVQFENSIRTSFQVNALHICFLKINKTDPEKNQQLILILYIHHRYIIFISLSISKTPLHTITKSTNHIYIYMHRYIYIYIHTPTPTHLFFPARRVLTSGAPGKPEPSTPGPKTRSLASRNHNSYTGFHWSTNVPQTSQTYLKRTSNVPQTYLKHTSSTTIWSSLWIKPMPWLLKPGLNMELACLVSQAKPCILVWFGW